MKQNLFEIVDKLVKQHDPLDLIAGGAPHDEYRPEVTMIVERLPVEGDWKAVSAVVRAVFIEMFGEDGIAEGDIATTAYEAIAKGIVGDRKESHP